VLVFLYADLMYQTSRAALCLICVYFVLLIWHFITYFVFASVCSKLW